ncbi:DUF302 domain-containing protein [Mycobacterium spongiae]|uniref:DUF302 domain-containing protein n=1 Tax=Mycobacterium spongiae TaxID=886343 RepID=A0A975K0H3_9MYCO|nr:DUF302 domain-containing protein [Mycobacterium spongiae]QUR68690.1 DUF302 domain-containing protein [Mycobacterium spongiae]
MSFASRPVVARLVAGAAVVAFLVAGCTGGSDGGTGQSTSAAAAGDAESAHAPRAVSTTFISYASGQNFEATVDALHKAAADNGMMIVGDVNQDAELAATGLQLPGAHSFFVGNPKIGKTFFESTQAIGAVIPVRVSVWVDGDGPAHISYFDPAPEFAAVDPDLGDGGQQVSQAIRTIAEAAAGGGGPTTTTAVETTFITVDAVGSFEATIGSLHDAAAEHGMTILGDVNQETRLEAIGLQSQRAHSFFVGDPQMGTTLFGATQAIAAVVPGRVHVWSDGRSPAHISYFDPAPMFTAVDPALSDAGRQLSQEVHAIAEAAAKQ